MEASNFSKLRQYSSAINVQDFVDYLISQNVLDVNAYLDVWQKKEGSRLNEIFNKIDKKGWECIEKVLRYLDDLYPDIEKIIEDSRNFRVCSVKGGFPKLPPNYVKRTTLSESVKIALEKLQWDEKLVVYGMMGYGKSCLVNEVLNEQTIRKYFDNQIYWINLGEHQTTHNILQPMWRLYTSASETKASHCPDDVQTLKNYLTELFLEPRLNNSLLILDDVCNSEVLPYFDIRCKTVITTQDKNILRKEDAAFIEVKTGFSCNESMELFKKSLSTSKDLPASAEEIHWICKGHPMLISLIGSYLRDTRDEVFGSNNEIWQYIKSMFLRGEYRLNEFDEDARIPSELIRKCIDKLLTNQLKSLYEDLAIFLQDVNIPPEVLEVLWDRQPFQVRNIMNKFAEKSLIVPFYHNDLKTFIYGIHDIHLNYLKEETKDRIASIHRKLISGYDRITAGDYSKLPNDNYTLQFIGYHLCCAQDFEKFRIYLDLRFVEAKIKAVGKEDVLRDMVKYERYITRNDDALRERLDCYKEFVLRYGGNLYNNKETDIVQYALQEPKNSYVFKEAMEIALKSENLYFRLQRPVDELDYSQTIHVKDDITTACFVDSPHHILIGTTNGKIKLFYEQYEKEISYFVGHSGPVKQLHISNDKRHFLSVSDDGSVILWKFSADSARNSLDLSTSCVPVSPKTKQKDWQDVFTPDGRQIHPKRRFRLKDDQDYLISANFDDGFPENYRIITGSHKGNVSLWDASSGEQLSYTGNRGIETPCVTSVKEGAMNLVVFACDDKIFKYELTKHATQLTFKYYESLCNGEKCNSFFANDSDIVVVGDKKITLWKGVKHFEGHRIEDGDKRNVFATVTDDAKFLIVSTNQNTIYVFDVEKMKVVKEFENKGLTRSLDTYYDENNSVHILLIGSDKRTLQQCHIQPCAEEPQVAKAPLFLPCWRRKLPMTVLVGVDNKIQVYRGYNQVTETESIEAAVTCSCFTTCGDYVIYGLSNGRVHRFNVRTRHDTQLPAPTDTSRVVSLKTFDKDGVAGDWRSSCSTSSSNNDESIDVFNEIIVSVTENHLVTVYDEKIVSRIVQNPIFFFGARDLLMVNGRGDVLKWNLDSDEMFRLGNPATMDADRVFSAAVCDRKALLAVTYKNRQGHVVDVYHVNGESLTPKRRLVLDDEPKCVAFSYEGALLAVGLKSGAINVYNVQADYKSTTLNLHKEPVEHLLFSRSVDPILVSLGEHIAWWNLKSLKTQPKKGRPVSLDIVGDFNEHLNISFWCDKKPILGFENLLSCVKLRGKAQFLSASQDFNAFLTIDEKGNLYIMDVVLPSSYIWS